MGTDIVAYRAQLAAQAQKIVEHEPLQSGNFLSIRGGILKYGDEVMPGNMAAVVILDAIRENTFYVDEFDENDPMPPTCYAFGRTSEEMAPHPSMQADLEYFEPQHDECTGCPMNAWGSARTGRGKACGEKRRLVMIPAGMYTPKPRSRDFDLELYDDESHFRTVDTVSLRVPVMSVKNWAKYVHDIAAAHNLPPHGVLTNISVVPDERSQYLVQFEMLEIVPDNLLEAIIGRYDTQQRVPFQGYAPPGEAEEKPAPAKAGALKGLRRR